jgi:hypothetical protein
MAKQIRIPTFTDDRGSLSVIENELGFAIRRVFYIYNAEKTRGGHGHKKAKIGMIALNGHVRVHGQSSKATFDFTLEEPGECLMLEPQDWHEMDLSPGSILLVLASEPYDKNDYFFEKPRKAI